MNTFVVYDCSKRKNILITQSARKAKEMIFVGAKIEVWNDDALIETMYVKNIGKIEKYIDLQKEYIARKQMQAEQRNRRRGNHGVRH